MSIPATGLTQSCRPREIRQEPVTQACDDNNTSNAASTPAASPRDHTGVRA